MEKLLSRFAQGCAAAAVIYAAILVLGGWEFEDVIPRLFEGWWIVLGTGAVFAFDGLRDFLEK